MASETARLTSAGMRFEKRSVDAVSEAVLKRCGFCDPLSEEEDAPACVRLEDVARSLR